MTILALGGVVVVLFCAVAYGVLKLAEWADRAMRESEDEKL